MYSFDYDPARKLLTVVQQGYWTLGEFRDYERDFLTLHNKIRLGCKCYRVLSDCRDYPVQSSEVGAAFAPLFQKLMDENKGHYAIIAASMLNKIQAKRAIPQPNVEIFTDSEWDKAMAWLFEAGSLPE